MAAEDLRSEDKAPDKEPAGIEPPVNEPPENEPPENEPPENEPLVNEPPVNEPPVNEPPVNEPPVNEPTVNAPAVDMAAGNSGLESNGLEMNLLNTNLLRRNLERREFERSNFMRRNNMQSRMIEALRAERLRKQENRDLLSRKRRGFTISAGVLNTRHVAEEFSLTLQEEADQIAEVKKHSDHKLANVFKERGNAYVLAGDLENAFDSFTAAIDLFPQDAIYYNNRALCSVKVGKYEDAVKDCNTALELNSFYIKAYYRRMQAFEHLGRYIDALKECTTILFLDGSHIEAVKSIERLSNKLQPTLTTNPGPHFSTLHANEIEVLPFEDYCPIQCVYKHISHVNVTDPSKIDTTPPLRISDDQIDEIFNSPCGPFIEIKRPLRIIEKKRYVIINEINWENHKSSSVENITEYNVAKIILKDGDSVDNTDQVCPLTESQHRTSKNDLSICIPENDTSKHALPENVTTYDIAKGDKIKIKQQSVEAKVMMYEGYEKMKATLIANEITDKGNEVAKKGNMTDEDNIFIFSATAIDKFIVDISKMDVPKDMNSKVNFSKDSSIKLNNKRCRAQPKINKGGKFVHSIILTDNGPQTLREVPKYYATGIVTTSDKNNVNVFKVDVAKHELSKVNNLSKGNLLMDGAYITASEDDVDIKMQHKIGDTRDEKAERAEKLMKPLLTQELTDRKDQTNEDFVKGDGVEIKQQSDEVKVQVANNITTLASDGIVYKIGDGKVQKADSSEKLVKPLLTQELIDCVSPKSKKEQTNDDLAKGDGVDIKQHGDEEKVQVANNITTLASDCSAHKIGKTKVQKAESAQTFLKSLWTQEPTVSVTHSIFKKYQTNNDFVKGEGVYIKKRDDDVKVQVANNITTLASDGIVLPSPPKSSQQFYKNWKTLTAPQKYVYLKSIDVNKIKQILDAGFDSYVLSDIINILYDYYLPAEEPSTTELLHQMAKIQHMPLLTLFLTNAEKKKLDEIIDMINKVHVRKMQHIKNIFALPEN